MTKGVLALLGSGETAPGMTKVHRELLERLNPVRAVNLDTAYGFQGNVPQMTEKLVDYFSTSLQTTLAPLHFVSYQQSTPLERTVFKQQVRGANFVFAGPGSPSYAVAQWAPLHIADELQAVLDNDGTLCFSSAAALTLGAFTPPIYEVYKAGAAPYWIEGLNVMAHAGLNCVVIPHFDNQEGGNYDTRFCYLGEERLHYLESLLPPDVATLGVDEHTALILDFEQDCAEVLGKSHAYWRLGSSHLRLDNGSTTPLSKLRTIEYKTATPLEPPNFEADSSPAALGEIAASANAGALEALAKLVKLAENGGEGRIDPTPLIEGILAARSKVRADGHYDIADQLRQTLISAGVEIHDSPEGATWSLDSRP